MTLFVININTNRYEDEKFYTSAKEFIEDYISAKQHFGQDSVQCYKQLTGKELRELKDKWL